MKLPRLPGQLAEKLKLRRTLRKSTGLQFAFAERIAFLNPALWDEIAGTKLFLSRDYLGALEQAAIPHMQHRYAIAFDQGRPVAIAAMQLLHLGLEKMRPLADPADAEGAPSKLQQRALVCGNLLSYGLDGVAFAPGLDEQTRWHTLAEMLYRVRRADKLQGQTQFVLVKDFDNAAFSASQVLAKLSYSPVETEPNMVLTLDPAWKSHDDYLASLTSKFRSNIKQRILKPVADGGYALVQLSPGQVADYTDRMQALYLAVQANASLRPVTVTPAFWTGMANLGAHRATVCALLQDDRLAGFLLVLLDGEEATAAQIGFDRALASEGLPLYLRLLHASVDVAIRAGAKRLIFGRTALEPKARLGCKPVDTHLWLRHRQPVINTVAKRFFNLIQHDEAPDIDPFKKG